MGEGACQPDNFTKYRLGFELSCDMSHHFVCFVALVIQSGAMAKSPNFGHCTTTINVWERIGEKTLSTILHSLWERGRVNLIFSTNTGRDVC